MRHFPSIAYSEPRQRASTRPMPRAIAATDDQERMLRGVFHAAMLSLAAWVTAGYLAFILR